MYYSELNSQFRVFNIVCFGIDKADDYNVSLNLIIALATHCHR